jgi:hypothetical protein
LDAVSKQSVSAHARWFGVVKVVVDVNEEFIEVTSSLGVAEFALDTPSVFRPFA